MKLAALLLLLAAAAQAELRVPAVTDYTDPNPNTPLKKWTESGQKVLWFGKPFTRPASAHPPVIDLPPER